MRKLLVFLFLLPLLASAQSSLDGTWKVDFSKSKLEDKPEVRVLKDGMYECRTCRFKYTIKADGSDQQVTGNPYMDSLSVKVVDDKHIERSWKKDGRITGSDKQSVSDDGNTTTIQWTDNSAENGKTITGQTVMKRVAKGPAGSHAVSGSWKPEKVSDVTEEGMLLTLKVEGDSLTMSTPTGQGYTAKFDGTEAPFTGDPGIRKVSLKKLTANSIQETDMDQNGKVVNITTMSSNGKELTLNNDDKLRGTKTRFVATKQ